MLSAINDRIGRNARDLTMPTVTLGKLVLITVTILLGAFAANSVRIGPLPMSERSAAWRPASDRAGPARHLHDPRAPAKRAIYGSIEHDPIPGGFAVGGFYGRWDEELDF